MTTYSVTLKVIASKLPLLLTTIEATAGIELANVATLDETAEEKKPKAMRFKDGKRNKGISARDLILKVLYETDKGMAKIALLESAFVKYGFAPNSLSPALSYAKRDELVKIDGSIVYLLPKGRLTAPVAA